MSTSEIPSTPPPATAEEPRISALGAEPAEPAEPAMPMVPLSDHIALADRCADAEHERDAVLHREQRDNLMAVLWGIGTTLLVVGLLIGLAHAESARLFRRQDGGRDD